MEKQGFSALIAQSQEEFRRQFDPTSITYHNGDPTIVPLYGQRIPQSMPTLYPENYNPNSPLTQDSYGELYKNIQLKRNRFLNLKKSLAKICPIKQAFLRHQQIFTSKGDPNNSKHIQTFQQNIQKQKINLKAAQDELAEFIVYFKDQKQFQIEIQSILKDSHTNFKDKQSLTDFNFKVKRLSAKAFTQAQNYLQQLKKIKKQYIKNSEVKEGENKQQ